MRVRVNLITGDSLDIEGEGADEVKKSFQKNTIISSPTVLNFFGTDGLRYTIPINSISYIEYFN